MKTTVFFLTVSNDKKEIEKELDYLNFHVVLLDKGYFPRNCCVWMRWLKGEDKETGEHFFDKFDGTFEVRKLGISLIRGTVFPESLVWDGDYGEIFVLGTAEELMTYIECFLDHDHAQEAVLKHRDFPNAFIYKLDCEKISNGNDHVVKVIDKSFLYKSNL